MIAFAGVLVDMTTLAIYILPLTPCEDADVLGKQSRQKNLAPTYSAYMHTLIQKNICFTYNFVSVI